MTNEAQPFDNETYLHLMAGTDQILSEDMYAGWEACAQKAAELAARTPAPVVGEGPSDEELVTIYQEAAMRAEPSAHGLVVDQFDQIEAGIRAVREALAAQEVQVPDAVLEIRMARDHAGAEWSVEVADGRVAFLFGAATFQEAITAIEQAEGGQE